MKLTQEQTEILRFANASCIANKSKEELVQLLFDYGDLLEESKKLFLQALLEGEIEMAREYAEPF